MKITMTKTIGVMGAALALTVAGLSASTTGASAQTSAAAARPAMVAAVPTVFDLNGTYTDGGTARPVISNVNDVLTVNMSSQHRPNASGVVINSDTILITFPDDATYTAKLQAPGTIRWSNGSAWQKVNLVTVPNVIGSTVTAARARLTTAGLRVGTVTTFVDFTCAHIGEVGRQSPGAGTQVFPGSAVNLRIGVEPSTPGP
jgi:hypothetical protein